ncbi:MAG: orotidine-5'-phosphate decarboxylase [Kangiellaceae bacterium]|nr:orotidine-5'-phosphate decarboxylase [Kangiellaceae bacterium]
MAKQVIVALDFSDKYQAEALVDRLDPKKCRLKVGKEMFTLFGPDWVRALSQRGFDVFLDLKFHDIPNTVAQACLAAADLGVWMLNVHASGGPVMMEKAAIALQQSHGDSRPLLTAVTVLTSMDEQQLASIGIARSVDEQVLALAKLSQQSGLDGVVCSAREAAMLRATLNQDFKLVTPGIRPVFAATDDQVRIMTPNEAIKSGADYLVIGRPITQAEDPMLALEKIELEISA